MEIFCSSKKIPDSVIDSDSHDRNFDKNCNFRQPPLPINSSCTINGEGITGFLSELSVALKCVEQLKPHSLLE